MSSINGLNRIAATSIDNSGVIRLGTSLNPGTSGQVIKSNGADNAASWENETPHISQPLIMGNNVNLTSGNPNYDGGVAETINAVDTTYQGSATIDIDTTTNPDTISVIKVPNELVMGTNLSLTSGNPDYDGAVTETINAVNTTYQGSATIDIDTTTNPDTISVIKVPQQLNIGANLSLASGSLFYNGSVNESLNALDTPTPNKLTIGEGLVLDSAGLFFNGSNPETINSIPDEFIRDMSTGYFYRFLLPGDFLSDNDSSGYNRCVIADTGRNGAIQCWTGTQYYHYFRIPQGFRLTGHRVNLTDGAGTPQGTTPAFNFYTNILSKTITTDFVNATTSAGYNTDNTGYSLTSNADSATWNLTKTYTFYAVQCYKNPWSSLFYNTGGWLQFEKI